VPGVSVFVPTTLDAALGALAAEPDAHVLAGGTDLMVEVNYGHRRPAGIVAVGRIAELRGWSREADGTMRIGATTTYTDLLSPELAEVAPALAAASRTVGSPQIRNAGTIGGNLATASPAGDTLPVLAALDAEVEIASTGGRRRLPVLDLITGPKRTALVPGELIVAVRLAAAAPGDVQEYLKVGTRNAMVISVAGLALIFEPRNHRVRVALGSVGPGPLRAAEAEAWAAGHIDWEGRTADTRAFGNLVAAAARPIDDHRSTADYRRHAIGVLATRALSRSLAA
jgi:CO/xanthine dehydrogenase FAD-binding subunit